MHPWSKLVTDIFHFEDASYLLIVDSTLIIVNSRLHTVHTVESGFDTCTFDCMQVIFCDLCTYCKQLQANLF